MATKTGSVTFLANPTPFMNYQNRRIRINYKEVTNDAANTSSFEITGVDLYSDVGAVCYINGIILIDGSEVIRMEGSSSTNGGRTTSKSNQWVPIYRNQSSATGQYSNPVSSSPITIPHNTDGSKTITVGLGKTSYSGFVVNMPQRETYNDGQNFYASTTQNVALTSIETWKTGTMSFNVGSVTTGQTATISIENQTGSNLTPYHTLAYSYGSGSNLTSGLSKSSAILKGNGVVSFTPTTAALAPYLTNAKQATATFTIKSYKDAACTQLIGTATGTITVVLKESDILPTKSSNSWASTTYYNTGTIMSAIAKYVRGYSKARTSFNASGISFKYGASAASWSVTYNGTRSSGNPATTGTINELTATITRTVTDTRGCTYSDTVTISLNAYSAPTLSAISARVDGTSLKAKATATCASIDGANTVSLKARYKVAGGSYGSYTNITSGTEATLYGSASNVLTYVLEFLATDTVGSTASYTKTVPGAVVPIGFKPGGKAIRVGGVPVKDEYFDVALPVCGNAASLFGSNAEIPSGADLNSYKECGTWCVASDAIAASLNNCPTTVGGSFVVRDGNSRGRLTSQTYCYRHQFYIPFSSTYRIYMRTICSSGTAGVWTYGDWRAIKTQSVTLAGNDGSIPSGADLNDYYEYGQYSISSATVAASLLNSPAVDGFSVSSGTLIVRDPYSVDKPIETGSGTIYRQQVYIDTQGRYFHIRTFYTSDHGATWSYYGWNHFLPYGSTKTPASVTATANVAAVTSWKHAVTLNLPDAGPWMIAASVSYNSAPPNGIMLATGTVNGRINPKAITDSQVQINGMDPGNVTVYSYYNASGAIHCLTKFRTAASSANNPVSVTAYRL